IAGIADAAHVERAVRTPDRAIHACLETLHEPEHASLIVIVDFLDEHALETAVRHVSVHHLAGVGADIERHRIRRRVADFILRQPHDRRRFGQRTIACWVDFSEAIEYPLPDVHDFARGQPIALVVGDEHLAIDAVADSIRRSETACVDLRIAGLRIDSHERSAVGCLRVSGRAAGQYRRAEGRVERAILVEQPEPELVKVVGHAPVVAHELVLIDERVSVAIDELRELLFLHDVDSIAYDFEPERLGQSGCDLLDLDLRRIMPLEALDYEYRTLGAPRAHHHATIRKEVHAADLRLERFRSNVHEPEARMHGLERQRIAGYAD